MMMRRGSLAALSMLLLVVLLHAASSQAGYGDNDYDCGTGEYTNGEIENVAYSEDNGLNHYPGLEDLDFVKRNNLTFWVPNAFATWPTSNPSHSDREYLAIFSAGAQGVGIFGLGGRPNVTTGQRDQWSDSFGGGPDRLYRDVCDRGLYSRMRDDPSLRFPSDSTSFIVNFDNRYLWTDEPSDLLDAVNAWVIYVKSLADPQRLKGIYLAGASMGGGLMAEIAARLNASTDGWELVPLIVQGMDPVLGKNRLGTVHPLTGGTAFDNLSSSDPEHYFYRTNPGSSTFVNAFPLKNKIRMNTIIGGGEVVGGYDVRSYSYVQGAPNYNDFDLTWLRQTSLDLDHEVIGRNWNSPIVAGTGTFDSYRAMDHWRDSYSELSMRGDPVYYLPVDSDYGGPGSHGVEHDWGDIQTAGSAFYTSGDRSPVKLHESLTGTSHTVTVYRNITIHADRLISFRVTAPPYALGPPAVFGGDYEIVGYGSMPAEGIEIFMLPGELQVSFDVKTVYDSAVESDEYVYLQIEDGQYVGIRGNVQQGILMEIVDHNSNPATEESCAAIGLFFDPVSNLCIAEAVPALPDLPCCVIPPRPFFDLIARIEILDLPLGNEVDLVATARSALIANLGGLHSESKDRLATFVNDVNALRDRGISNNDADALIAEANAIVVLLNAHPAFVPTLTNWSLILMVLLSLAAGTIAIGWRRRAREIVEP